MRRSALLGPPGPDRSVGIVTGWPTPTNDDEVDPVDPGTGYGRSCSPGLTSAGSAGSRSTCPYPARIPTARSSTTSSSSNSAAIRSTSTICKPHTDGATGRKRPTELDDPGPDSIRPGSGERRDLGPARPTDLDRPRTRRSIDPRTDRLAPSFGNRRPTEEARSIAVLSPRSVRSPAAGPSLLVYLSSSLTVICQEI